MIFSVSLSPASGIRTALFISRFGGENHHHEKTRPDCFRKGLTKKARADVSCSSVKVLSPYVLQHILVPNVLEHRQLPQQVLFQVSPLPCLLLDGNDVSEVLANVHRREGAFADSRTDGNLQSQSGAVKGAQTSGGSVGVKSSHGGQVCVSDHAVCVIIPYICTLYASLHHSVCLGTSTGVTQENDNSIILY